jgi:hypothetical protein
MRRLDSQLQVRVIEEGPIGGDPCRHRRVCVLEREMRQGAL